MAADGSRWSCLSQPQWPSLKVSVPPFPPQEVRKEWGREGGNMNVKFLT